MSMAASPALCHYLRTSRASATKLVMVLTRHKGYRKNPVPEAMQKLYRRHFRSAPGLVDRLVTAPQRYNERMDRIDALEEEGKVFVIRPRKPVTVSRIEKRCGK